VTVYDSNKQKDALKVGRFGLGFKSVFHMTGIREILISKLTFKNITTKPLY